MLRLHLVQLAGGKGLRVGGDTPKQFRETGSGLLLAVSLKEFLNLPADAGKVASITVTASSQWDDELNRVLSQLPPGPYETQRAEPGGTRTESTWHALELLAQKMAPQADDLVAVHDAARPFATAELLAKLVAAAGDSGAAVPGISVADTILQKTEDSSEAIYLERANLVAVQTPQVFRWDLLYDAHKWAAQKGQSFTDDGSLVAHRGTNPVVVPGQQSNWKVTTEGDWLRAAEIL